MSFRDSALRAAQSARGIPQRLGLRTIRVWVRRSTRTNAALLTGGAETHADIELEPRPAVSRVETADPSYWGAEAVGLVDGQALAEYYEIGPITPKHSAGGYSIADLLPLTTTTKTANRILLADDAEGGLLGTVPVEFEIVSVRGQDKGRALRWMLLVRRVREHARNG